MRLVFTSIVLASFIGLAVFGFMGMNHGNSDGHAGCLAASANGTTCPGFLNILGIANFHIDAFKTFSSVPFDGSLTILFLLLLTACVGYRFLIRAVPPNAFSFLRFRSRESSKDFLKKSFTRWLALHENSPSPA